MEKTLRDRLIDVFTIRQLQPNSINTYLSIFGNFEWWLKKNNLEAEHVTHDQLQTYIGCVNSPSLIRQKIGVIKNVYEFCLGQGYKTYGFPYPRKKRLIPEYFTPYELDTLFSKIRNPKQLCIIKLQYACALRVHEVVKVKRSDFIKKMDPHQQKFVYDLRVCGKGGRVDEIPVPDETVQEIFAYWETLRVKPKEYLFEGQFAQYYSSRSVQIIVKRAMHAAGIKKNGSTHLLRHSRASHLIQVGVDVTYIQKLLRHASIKTTLVYTHFKPSDMRVIFNRAEAFIQESINQEKQLLLKQG